MNDDDLGAAPWADETIPLGVDAHRVYEYAISIGGSRRRRRRQRRAIGGTLAAAVIIVLAVSSGLGATRSTLNVADKPFGQAKSETPSTESTPNTNLHATTTSSVTTTPDTSSRATTPVTPTTTATTTASTTAQTTPPTKGTVVTVPTTGPPPTSSPTTSTTPVTVPPPPPPVTFTETVGGVAHTWTNYSTAGGTEGPNISAFSTVQIVCRIAGFKVADGNTWWYRIASAPWAGKYYVSADAFYNNGATSGSLQGTPFFDPAVTDCGSLPPTYAETTGGNANTWTNYTIAGGTEGPTITPFATVQIACKIVGFKVADGNTWWYRIASSPWIYGYYVSTDAFYNNGATSGTLLGTPFVDPAVPTC